MLPTTSGRLVFSLFKPNGRITQPVPRSHAPIRPFTRVAFRRPTPPPQGQPGRAGQQSGPPAKGIGPPGRNGNIPHDYVRLVDPEDSILRPFAPLSRVLAERDKKYERKKYDVVLVSANPEPIVKFVHKGEEYRKVKQQKQKARETAKNNGEKEIQMTWDAAGTDHQRKIDQVKEALSQGLRVIIAHAPKAGVRHRLSPQEMRSRVEVVVNELKEAGREWKPREAGPRITLTYLESIQSQQVDELDVEISWVSTEASFGRLLKSARNALSDGKRVKLLFAPPDRRAKSSSRENDKDEDEDKMTRKAKATFVSEALGKLGNVREWKNRDEWKKTTTLYLEDVPVAPEADGSGSDS